MTTMSVPSTLVKCLYLFFDLPHMAEASVGPTQQPPPPPPPPPTQDKTPSQGPTHPELSLGDRRALLQKVFVQVRTDSHIAFHRIHAHRDQIHELDFARGVFLAEDLSGDVFCPFHQILVKLCTFVSPAEELAQKDDLQLLFSAITSWCPPHNLPWRRSAGEVLTTISRHGLSVNVVKYIHGTYECHECESHPHLATRRHSKHLSLCVGSNTSLAKHATN